MEENLVFGIIPDVHRPYHDEKSYQIALKVIEHVFEGIAPRKRRLLLLGDYADFYAVNMHHGHTHEKLKHEIEDVNKGLDELDQKFDGVKKIYLEGNHEHRLERFIHKHAYSLFGLTQWEMLFRMDSRPNWTIIPYNNRQLYRLGNSELFARHSPLSYASPKASQVKAQCSLIHGCTHRRDEYTMKTLDGREHVHASFGWLGNPRHRVYDYMKNLPQWSHGFGFVYIIEGQFFIHQLQIKNYTTVYNGTVFCEI